MNWHVFFSPPAAVSAAAAPLPVGCWSPDLSSIILSCACRVLAAYFLSPRRPIKPCSKMQPHCTVPLFTLYSVWKWRTDALFKNDLVIFTIVPIRETSAVIGRSLTLAQRCIQALKGRKEHEWQPWKQLSDGNRAYSRYSSNIDPVLMPHREEQLDLNHSTLIRWKSFFIRNIVWK